MNQFPAWHLPALPHVATRVLAETRHGSLLAPVLSTADVATCCERALAAGGALRAMSNDQVIAAIDGVARCFLDSDHALRRQALAWLPEVTGYSHAMTAAVLDRMAADWTAPALRRLLAAELPDPRALERFVPRAPGQRVRALTPRLAFHVLAGNVPGVGVTSLVRGLLVRAPAVCKTASGEPILPVLFARALAESAPDLADAIAVAYWTGGDEDLERPALEHCDVVIHYGGAESLADLRRRAPGHLRIVDHGPRLSFALVAREHAGRAGVAAAAARAAAMFDQQGCVSPHAIYVEEGGRVTPEAFAADVARELEQLAAELPRGQLSTSEAAAVQHLRATVEFRAIAGEATRLWAGENLAWTVAFDPDPAFSASCLGRFLWIKPISALENVLDYLGSFRDVLQTVAIAAPRARLTRLAERFALAGCTRITSLHDMPFPPPAWHHDGRGPLLELLRWADLEPGPK